jgi:hypothetical protein
MAQDAALLPGRGPLGGSAAARRHALAAQRERRLWRPPRRDTLHTSHARPRSAPARLALARTPAGAADAADLRRQQLERLLDPWGPSRVSWVKDHQLLVAHKVSLNVYHLPPPCCNCETPGAMLGQADRRPLRAAAAGAAIAQTLAAIAGVHTGVAGGR